MVVIDRDFCKLKARILKFFDHFDADGPIPAFEFYQVEDFTPDQAKVTVYIAQAKAEGQAADVVINFPDDFSVQGVVARNFVAVNNVDTGMQRFDQVFQFEWVVLGVTVCVEDPFFACQANPCLSVAP